VLGIFAGGGSSGDSSSSGTAGGSEHYEVVDKISEGGMGEVFRARQVELGRLVALKRIKSMRLTSEDQARFKKEARVLSGLSNPHTINVFDAGIVAGDSPFYVMELLDGVNLRELIEKDGTLPAARVIHVMRQATLSLHEAHAQGLIHRDIKPANLMMCRYGGEFDFVKVLDFGLVKTVTQDIEQGSFDAITHAGELPGTPAFLAPESVAGSAGITPRVDIYALAAIGHFLLTGRHLFDAESPVAMVRAQLHEHPPLASEKSPQAVPEELDQLLARCLEKDADKRPQTAAELLDLLEDMSIRHPWTRTHAEACWRDVPALSERARPKPVLPSAV
jgi:serine/threonine-protein kinase